MLSFRFATKVVIIFEIPHIFMYIFALWAFFILTELSVFLCRRQAKPLHLDINDGDVARKKQRRKMARVSAILLSE